MDYMCDSTEESDKAIHSGKDTDETGSNDDCADTK